MNRIFRFQIPPGSDKFVQQVPEGSKVICVEHWKGNACIWIVVDVEVRRFEDRVFYIYGTGHPFPESLDDLSYVGKFIPAKDNLIFFVFEYMSPERRGFDWLNKRI